MRKVLIYLEKDHEKDSLELLKAVECLHPKESYHVYGYGESYEKEMMKGHFHFLIQDQEPIDLMCKEHYDVGFVTDRLEELHKHYEFDSILITASHFGRMLAPRLAMRLDTGLVADVTAMEVKEGEIRLLRPAYSGKLMAAIRVKGGGPRMMTIRKGVFDYDKSPKLQSETLSFPFTSEKPEIYIKEYGKKERVNLNEWPVLVAGGNGTGDYYEKLKEFAKALGGKHVASRKIVDKDLVSRSLQVGQSGQTVSPNLYIAMGISGSIQHMEGLKNVQDLIAVNTNINAPICSRADLVFEGDGEKLIDGFMEILRKNRVGG